MMLPLTHWTRCGRSVALALTLVVAAPAAQTAVLTSSDGKTREFAVVVSASRAGLTVRDAPGGRDVLIPWARLDVRKTAEVNPWFQAAREKATAGETVVLNLGLPNSVAPAPAAAAPKDAEWRTVKTTVPAPEGTAFGSLSLSAYVHREVAVPRLAVVWVGSPSPLAKRGDAADLVRRMQGALVVADFSGPMGNPADGSGPALVAGVADLLKEARTGGAQGAKGGTSVEVPVSRGREGKESGAEEEADTEADGEGAGSAPRRTGPALVVMGRGEAASFVWSLVCSQPQDVMAAVMLDGVHAAESTAGAFATPCLFLESSGAPAPTGEDLKRPYSLWRHFSTDGCRWCYAAPPGDPLALAVAFARDVAAASPYVEALEMLESWEGNKLRHRIPMPVMTAKSFKEDSFRLSTPDGASVFSVASKKGAARNDLVWVPSAAFAARLTGR